MKTLHSIRPSWPTDLSDAEIYGVKVTDIQQQADGSFLLTYDMDKPAGTYEMTVPARTWTHRDLDYINGQIDGGGWVSSWYGRHLMAGIGR